MRNVWQLVPVGKGLTVFRVPFTCVNLPSAEMDLERSLKTQSSKSTVFPLPVGAEMTMFASEWKQTGKHSLWSELKYLHVKYHESYQLKQHFAHTTLKAHRISERSNGRQSSCKTIYDDQN